ncbi:MAG: ATP synthase F1 subunit epsilon [Kiloniellales bacterium]|jgi:F-type H+-transporting ATPase subunit epsilon
MADEQVEFELVTPEKLLMSSGVDMVVVPGAEGDFGVLPRHTPMISTVRPGVVQIFEDGKVSETLFVGWGFAEVTEARCTLLADEAMPISEIDRAAAEQRLNDAREDRADAGTDEARASAERQIAVCEAMLRVSAN